MLLRIKDWNNNIREIHCFTYTHNSLSVCFSGSNWAPLRLGPMLAHSKRQAWEAEERVALFAWQGTWKCQMKTSVNTLSSWAPGSQKGGWDKSKAEQPKQTWQNSAMGILIHTHPDVFQQCWWGWAAPQSQCKFQTRITAPLKSAKCSLEKPKVQARSSMAQKRLQYSDRLWELAQFVIHSVRCYPKQRNEKSVWRAMFWFRTVQAWGTFPFIFQNS